MTFHEFARLLSRTDIIVLAFDHDGWHVIYDVAPGYTYQGPRSYHFTGNGD